MMPPISERAEALKHRITDFMDEHIIPAEDVFAAQLDQAPDRWSIPPVMEELKARAKEEGLWNLFLPKHEFSDGLSNVEYAALCEVMGR